MKRPALLVLTTTFPRWEDDHEPGFVYELCRRLSADYEVHVIAPHARGSLMDENMGNCHVHRFRYAPERWETLAYNGGIANNLKRSPWKYLLVQGFLLGMFFRALRIGRQFHCRLIHAHWLLPTGLVGSALKTLLPGNNHLLLTAHGGDLHGLRGKLAASLRRWAVAEADAVSVVSHAMAQKAQAEHWPDTPVHIAPMGVDLQTRFTPDKTASPKPMTLLFAGRLVEKKGVQHLLAALPQLLKARPDLHVQIAGHGPLLGTLQAQVVRLRLDTQVHFSGRYTPEQLPTLIRAARLVVLPFVQAADGDEEGLGLTVIEAMGCGTPVIAGDVPAVHDMIEDGKNGLLVNPRDPHALAESIESLLGDPALADRLAYTAREHAMARFDWAVCTQRYAALFEPLSHTDSNTDA